MRIIIATDVYYHFVCGSTQFVRNLVELLQKRGHTVLIIAPSRTIHSEYYSADGVSLFGVASLPTIIQKTLRLSPPFFIDNKIEKVLRDFKPDVVHLQSHFFIPAVVRRIAERLGIPVVGTNHFMPENVFHHFHPPLMLENFIKRQLWNHLHKFFQKCDIITTPTKTAADLLTASGFKKEVRPVSNGIDLSRFHTTHDGTYLKERYAIPKKQVLLYVGRLDPEKNLDVVIRSLADILKKVDIHFIIAGRGSEQIKLKDLAGRLGISNNITFAGYVPDSDLPALYSIADCFIIAGNAELQSIATMEAMASGLPVLASDSVALPELVHGGENGFLFKERDGTEITKFAVQIFSDLDLKRRMGAKSIEMIKVHDINTIIEKFESVYEDAIKIKKDGAIDK